MKKVIGIFMAMVMVFVFVSMAVAENPKGYSGSEVQTMTEEWARSQNKNLYLERSFDGNCYYMIGVMENDYFKELTGKDFSIEELENIYYECDKYGFDWDVTNASVKLAGFYEGYDVYVLDISTSTVPLGSYYNGDDYVDYYNGSVLFMICEV